MRGIRIPIYQLGDAVYALLDSGVYPIARIEDDGDELV
jgi:hypothetical protein